MAQILANDSAPSLAPSKEVLNREITLQLAECMVRCRDLHIDFFSCLADARIACDKASLLKNLARH